MDLSKKKKIITGVMDKLKIEDDAALKLLESVDDASVPLGKFVIGGEYKEYANELDVAKRYSLLMHADSLLNLSNGSIAVRLYKNQSEMLKLEFIEEYMARTPIVELGYFKLWQAMFRHDVTIVSLYAAIIYRGMRIAERGVIFELTAMISDDKTYVLTKPLAPIERVHTIKFRSMGFIPQSPLMPQAELMKAFEPLTELNALASGTTIVVKLSKTISPIEIDTWMLRDMKTTKALLGEYAIGRGLNAGILKRHANIRYLECEGCKLATKSFEIIGDVDSYTDGYVVETLGADKWRFLCPMSTASPAGYKVPKYLLAPFVEYLTTETMSRVAAYHKHQQRLIMDKMFFSRTMAPSVEYLENLAGDADMSSVKHNLIITLEPELDIGKREMKSFYHVLSFVQNLNLKDKITEVLLNEFRNLAKYEEFTQILEKSSFPTSEIMLSYIVEMQKFSHILYKAFVDHLKEQQHDFDTGAVALDIILRTALKTAIDEKIRQEGSIMNVVNFKSRLLYIDVI